MTYKYSTGRQRFFTNVYQNHEVVNDPSSPYETSSEGYSYQTTVYEGTGTDRPLYKQVIRSRGNAQNQFYGRKYRFTSQIGRAEKTTSNYAYDFEGKPTRLVDKVYQRFEGHQFTGNPYLANPSSNGNAENLAKARFAAKARHASTQFQSGVFLGELRETIRAIKHPAAAIRAGLGNYSKAVHKRLRGIRPGSNYGTVRRAIGGTWLEYAFGWAPLLHDVESAMEALATYKNKFTPTIKIRSGANIKLVDPIQQVSLTTLWGTYYGSKTTTYTTKATMYGALSSRIGTDAPTFRGSFGLRARDVVPTIWELIPFSFVTDYFTNVGEILSASTFDNGDVSWCGLSTKCETDEFVGNLNLQRESIPVNTLTQKHTGSSTPGSVRSSASSLNRVENPGFIPSLTFSLPGVRQNFNLAALFASSTRTSRQFAKSLNIRG